MPENRIRLCRSNPLQAAHPVDPAAGAPRTGSRSLATQPGSSPGLCVTPDAPERRGGGRLSSCAADHQSEYADTLTGRTVWSVIGIALVLFTVLTELPIQWLALAIQAVR